MTSSLGLFSGLRPAEASKPCSCSFLPRRSVGPSGRGQLQVTASNKLTGQRKTKHFQQVVLKETIPGVGVEGELTRVTVGYFRNYLSPFNKAQRATEGVLASIQRDIDNRQKTADQERAKARAMATALSTINKFVIRKKTGENGRIFGSVTQKEIVAAIAQQTGRELDARLISLPEIKTTGSFEATIKLHPDVTGKFQVVVQKEKGTA
ncbi:hypothetical protein WJX84_010663 [Apatococcus fuscideae]|uniref:Large ribosomal subunit protein bL9c n=1 Tax=Apatococcus fuscideae TaxID=2026836 RepID=A0AAW1TKQ0_9CHLO